VFSSHFFLFYDYCYQFCFFAMLCSQGSTAELVDRDLGDLLETGLLGWVFFRAISI